MRLFYKPKKGYLGDVVPFYDENSKQFKLFYIFDNRKDSEPQKPDIFWYLLSTNDFLDYEEHGKVISGGKKEDQDYGIGTGSVIKVDRSYHAFYTGTNIYNKEQEKPEQAICHAVSNDLLNWKKTPEHMFYAKEDIYEKHDFRDPFVFWNEEEKQYWMFITTRIKEGPTKRRGCIALYKSKDLEKWNIHEPYFKPNLYYVLECPDLFRIGEWWYLLFSENNEVSTHYRMSRSLAGPWKSAVNDTLDASSFYAAKTASDGNKRYLFGWVPRKTGKNDYNNWEWGGNLIVHEIFQDTDGSLSVKVPDSIDKLLSNNMRSTLTPITGNWDRKGDSISAEASEGFVYSVSKEKMPSSCKISADIRFEESVKDLGIMLRVSEDYDSAYYIRLEPKKSRIVFDMFPRKSLYPRYTVTTINDSAFIPGHERYIKLLPNKTYKLKVFVENDICVIYLDNKVALTSRIYNLKQGKWGLFVNEGKAFFNEVKVCN